MNAIFYSQIFSSDNTDEELLAILAAQPISQIHWVHRDELNANLYNPNQMAPPEMKLLQESLHDDGWLFPDLRTAKGRAH
jgi:hypothetical protein